MATCIKNHRYNGSTYDAGKEYSVSPEHVRAAESHVGAKCFANAGASSPAKPKKAPAKKSPAKKKAKK